MLWRLISTLGCMFICVSSQSAAQKRRCVFQVTLQNHKYTAAGNVSGSVQLCENTHCCVGYFWLVDGRPKVDILACDVVEKSCPDASCKAQPRFNNYSKCVCNTDLCNSNITWSPLSGGPAHTHSSSPADDLMRTAVKLTVVFLLAMLIFFAAKWRRAFTKTKEDPLSSCQDYIVLPSSPYHAKSSDVHSAHVELQLIVGQGHFATVFQGRYKGSAVAVKVFPAAWKQRFIAEKEVYELPLMRHAGIVHFLGTGRRPDDGSWFIMLQFAEYGSLHSFLSKHTSSWTLSLKLCQSLSQGLSYLHSDLLHHDEHKPAVSHRDLSSCNVLVRADVTCVLCDFGSSTVLRCCSGPRSRYCHATDMEGHAQLGTLRYMSPEVLEGLVNLSSSSFLLQSDVYALGLLQWEIWMRCCDLFQGGVVPQRLLPYELELGAAVTLESLVQHVSYMDQRPSIPEHWELLLQGPALKELLTDCWDAEPDARLSAQCVVDRLTSLQSFNSP